MGVLSVLNVGAQLISSVMRTGMAPESRLSKWYQELFFLLFHRFLEVCAGSSRAAQLVDF